MARTNISPSPLAPVSAPDPKDRLRKLLIEARDDPAFFNEVILGGPSLWSRQEDICRLVAERPVTVVQSANGVGKSYLAAILVLWYLTTRPGAIVLTTAPTAVQLRNVLWGYIRERYTESRIPLGGRILSSPISKLEMGERWYAVGISTTKIEKLSGYHAANIMVVVDEASGVESEIFSALLSCNPEKAFYIGNPIRSDGHFYTLCQKAQDPSSGWGFAKISTLDSPHAHLERSPVGLADQGFLSSAKATYGEGGPWWIAHILGEFPDSCEDVLINRSWLDRSVQVYEERAKDPHARDGFVRFGPVRIAVDYAEGVGRDNSVVAVRDDNNLLDLVASNTWKPDVLAQQVAIRAQRWNVEPRHIAFDSTGSGSDFANRLRAVGLKGCRGYRGAYGAVATAVGMNLRSNSFWGLRRRLDPDLVGPDGSKQTGFAIPPQFMQLLRPQLSVLTYEINARGKAVVLSKESIKSKLGESPDYADALAISFCWGS